MRRKLLAAMALFTAVAFAVSVTTSAFGYAGYTAPCDSCHGTDGAAPTVTQTSNDGTNATYNISTAGAGHEWAVFKGTTKVAGTSGDGGTFTVPDGSTYDVYAIYGSANGGDSGSKVSISPTGGTPAPTTYTIAASAGANGAISPSGNQTVASGSNQTFTITPNTGYHVASLTVDGAAVTAATSYTFSSVAANHTIAATFAADAGAPTAYTIAASAGTSGTISPSGSQSVAAGSDATFTIMPNTGCHVASLTVDGVAVPAATSYTFNDVSANHTISATFAANSLLCTISPSAGEHGSISPSTLWTAAFGSTVTFYATPDEHYHVDKVMVDGTWAVPLDDDSGYTFANIQMDHTIAATFALDTFDIAATAGKGGSISSAGTQTVSYDDTTTYTIAPAAGYQIAEVDVDGMSVGQVSSYTFSNVSDDHTISATFVPVSSNFTITPSCNAGGVVTPGGTSSVAAGGSITFCATPDEGYHVGQVLVDNVPALLDDDGAYTFSNASANHTIAVTFALNRYTLTPSLSGHGSVSPSGATVVNPGDSKTFHFVPAAGYRLADVLVDGDSVGAVSSYTFTSVGDDHTIMAVFAAVSTSPASSKVSIKTSVKTVRVRHALTISGKLSGSGSHFSSTYVQIQRHFYGSSKVEVFRTVKVNSATGAFSSTFKPTSTKDRYYRIRFVGNRLYKASTTGWTKVVVK